MFTWKEGKREKVLKKHKVDFEKIKDIFDDPFSIDFTDEEHSTPDEIRYGIIGKTARYGLIALYYTFEDEITAKFITARRAEKWMVNVYEQQRYR